MDARIRIKRGLNVPVAGRPEQVIHDGPEIRHVALSGLDYIGLKPRLLVEEGESVRLGQPLFIDKHRPSIPFCSPGSGEIVKINRGPRRVLNSVVVRLEEQQGSIELYSPMSRNRITRMDHEEAAERLRETGLWAALRQRPFNKIPSPEAMPRSIFVTAMDTRPLAADPCVVVREQLESFDAGLAVMSLLTRGSVFVCTGPEWDLPLTEAKQVRQVRFEGPHPAGLPGTHIHYLDPVGPDRFVWHIGYQDVIAIGTLFEQGRLDCNRIVALGGGGVEKPRLIRSRQGASIGEISAAFGPACNECRIISGSVLGGRTASGDLAWLGRYHHQVSVIQECGHNHLFGWTGITPWRYSAARTFLRQAGHKRRHNITTAQNGRYSGMIPTRAFEKVLPLGILPSPLFRALLVRDTDQAQALGCLELDDEDLALCSFVCPAKIDYGSALRINLDQIEREG